MKDWKPPFYLFLAGRSTVNSREYYNDIAKRPGPRRILMKYTMSGCGTLYVNGKRFTVPEGWMFAIEVPGPYIYCYEEENAEQWTFQYFSIGYSGPDEILPAELRSDPLYKIADNPELLTEFTRLVDLRIQDEHRENLLHSALCYRFFLNYIAARNPQLTADSSGAAERLRVILEDRMSEELNLTEISKELGYTQEALTRLFHARFGLPPGQFLKRLRLRHACRLLESSTEPLKKISAQCGFATPNYFGRVFRASLGTSPGSYRRNPDPLRSDI